MAKPNETPAKNDKKNAEKKPNVIARIGLFFKRIFLAIVRGFRDMFAELKKVTWPSREELKNYTLVVLAFMVFMGIVIGVIDAGSAALMGWIVGI